MSRPLFLRIQFAIEAHDPYFILKRNAAGTLGLSSLQKVTVAMRMLAYGVAADAVDDYVRIGESTSIESLKRFVRVVVEVFGEEYLRSPNNDDISRLLAQGEARGFPGMLGSIDCMHWKWKNCPIAWKVNYSINGHDYTMGYYLADDIYPPWSTFVKTISCPRVNKDKHFAATQESARKDVERAFGVLQARFAIVHGPSRFWDLPMLRDIMKACIIMHYMIVEDERDVYIPDLNYDVIEENITVSHERTIELSQIIQNHRHIRYRGIHSQLQTDLVEHLWKLQGARMNA
ncbi:hypothetical protein HHK36_012528 [Tetracentron sinense]|uniref:Nuclease HARBI1 n=1 Tax=Tetracentron sinense TaxID=13715 RepID=A0A835DEM9_TETSI|nr:hypothetical protein HHK36_012528 [Tetracentron sinense]